MRILSHQLPAIASVFLCCALVACTTSRAGKVTAADRSATVTAVATGGLPDPRLGSNVTGGTVVIDASGMGNAILQMSTPPVASATYYARWTCAAAGGDLHINSDNDVLAGSVCTAATADGTTYGADIPGSHFAGPTLSLHTGATTRWRIVVTVDLD